jgi:hypothetical protein
MIFNNEYKLHTRETPRQIILEDFNLDLPIKGGWGYSLEDACIIDKNDSSVSQAIPFNGVSIEYVFVEKRLYEEMVVFRTGDERFGGIRWELDEQRINQYDGKPYDRLIFNVTAYHESIWDQLTSRFDAIKKGESNETLDELEIYRLSKIQSFKREYFFDIASFFGG